MIEIDLVEEVQQHHNKGLLVKLQCFNLSSKEWTNGWLLV